MIHVYTQCPECRTVFRVTADTLRAAQGRVRCGICSTGFSALDNLSEHPVPRAIEERPDDDTITVEELPGTEFIELSGVTGAEPDETADRMDDDDPAAVLAWGLEEDGEPEARGGDDEIDAIPDAALEFRGSAEDLERLFIEAGPLATTATQPDTAEPAGDADLERAIDEVAAGDFSGIEVHEGEMAWPQGADVTFEATDPGQVASILAFPAATTRPPGDAPAHGEPEPAPALDTVADLDRTDEYPILVIDEAPVEDGDAAAADEPPAAAEPAAAPVLLIPEALRRDAALSAAEELSAPSAFEAPEGPRRWPLLAAAVLLAVALAAQAAHHWREDLSRNPALGPWVLRAYGLLGLELPAPADLSAFELRQLGAASEPNQSGRIKVRASIVNRAPFAQPYPILRLTLQDRFGSTIGARELRPAEYLPGGESTASGLLGPAQRADAEVAFVDPGRDAVGFELDICVAEAAGLRCSADLPQSRP